MAVIIHNAVHTTTHISNLFAYAENPDKTVPDLITGVNCNSDTAIEEFELTRNIHNNNRGNILLHHYVQSFSPEDNITPKKANELGQQLVAEIAPGYQAVVVTHIDKMHIHNHIILNSIDMATGKKYQANQESYYNAREISDSICRENGLSTIEIESGLRGIDKPTYYLGMKGQSWKIEMIKNIDNAISCSNNKYDFIKYMEACHYFVKWQNENISFCDPKAQGKYIRAKSLAKQFGERYSMEGIIARLSGDKSYENMIATEKAETANEAQGIEPDVKNVVNNTTDHNEKEPIKQAVKDDNKQAGKVLRPFHAYNDDTAQIIGQAQSAINQTGKMLDSINQDDYGNEDKAKSETMSIVFGGAAAAVLFSLMIARKSYTSYRPYSSVGYQQLITMPGRTAYLTVSPEGIKELAKANQHFKMPIWSKYTDDLQIKIGFKEDDKEKILSVLKPDMYNPSTYRNMEYSQITGTAGRVVFLDVNSTGMDILMHSDIPIWAKQKDDGYVKVGFKESEKLKLFSELENSEHDCFDPSSYRNATYKEIVRTPGEVAYIEVNKFGLDLLKYTKVPLWSCEQENGNVLIAFKDINKPYVFSVLNSKNLYDISTYKNAKYKQIFDGKGLVSCLVVTPNGLDQLKDTVVPLWSKQREDGNILIAFKNRFSKYVFNTLDSSMYDIKSYHSASYDDVLSDGDKVIEMVLGEKGLEALKGKYIPFVTRIDGKENIHVLFNNRYKSMVFNALDGTDNAVLASTYKNSSYRDIAAAGYISINITAEAQRILIMNDLPIWTEATSNNMVHVLFKKTDKSKLFGLLENGMYDPATYKNVTAKELYESDKDVSTVTVKENEMQRLIDSDIPMSAKRIRGNDNVTVTFFTKDKNRIYDLLDKSIYGNVSYKLLKEMSNDLEYRILDQAGIEKLQQSDLVFASFKTTRNGKTLYNVIFDSDELHIYNRTVKNAGVEDRAIVKGTKSYSQIKAAAAAGKERLMHVALTVEEIKDLRQSKYNYAVVEKEGLYNVYAPKEEMKNILPFVGRNYSEAYGNMRYKDFVSTYGSQNVVVTKIGLKEINVISNNDISFAYYKDNESNEYTAAIYEPDYSLYQMMVKEYMYQEEQEQKEYEELSESEVISEDIEEISESSTDDNKEANVLQHIDIKLGTISYKELKGSGENLVYRTVDKVGYDKLSSSELKFACFEKKDNGNTVYNVAFTESSLKEYQAALDQKPVINRTNDLEH